MEICYAGVDNSSASPFITDVAIKNSNIQIVTVGPGKGWPQVQGKCPSCGCRSLFVGSGGYVTCAILSCKDPCAASDLLD